MAEYTILLADDHSMIRQGMEFMIEDLNIDHTIFHASNLEQVTNIIETHKIDLLVIDAHFPDGNSLSIIPQIKQGQPYIKILIFSGLEEEEYAIKFLNIGANGFLSKLSEEDEIGKALQSILDTGRYISNKTQNLLLDSLNKPQELNKLERLTQRELEIASMYAQGLGNLEIANSLDLKQNTVSTVKKRIFDKLEVSNLIELVEILKK